MGAGFFLLLFAVLVNIFLTAGKNQGRESKLALLVIKSL